MGIVDSLLAYLCTMWDLNWKMGVYVCVGIVWNILLIDCLYRKYKYKYIS